MRARTRAAARQGPRAKPHPRRNRPQSEGNSFSLSALERRIGVVFFYWDVFNVFLQVRGAACGGRRGRLPLDAARAHRCGPGTLSGACGSASLGLSTPGLGNLPSARLICVKPPPVSNPPLPPSQGIIGSTFFQRVQQIIYHPENLPSILGAALPNSSNFFIQFISMRALFLVWLRMCVPHGGVWQNWAHFVCCPPAWCSFCNTGAQRRRGTGRAGRSATRAPA